MFNKLKPLCQPTDIYTSQRLTIMILFIAGFFPFTVTGNASNKRLKRSLFGYSFAAFHISVFATSFAITILHQKSFVDYFFPSAKVVKIVNNMAFFNSILAIVVLYGSCIYLSNKIRTCFESLVYIDRKLNSLGVEINHKNGFVLSLYCFVGLAAVNLTFSITSFILIIRSKYNDIPGWPLWASYFQPPLAITIMVIFYTCILFEIKQRFKAMNQILWVLSEEDAVKHLNFEGSVKHPDESLQGSSLSEASRDKAIFKLIEDTITIQNDLCDVCSIAEDFFALKMLVIAGIAFVIIVLNAYYVIELAHRDIVQGKHGKSTKYFIFLLYQIFMNLLGIICIAQSSHSVSAENEECSTYVHKIMNKTSSTDVKNKLLEFSLQLIHRKIKFTSLNLFALNRKLFVMIVGTVTTYLFILLDMAVD